MAYKNFEGPRFKLEIPTDWVISSSLDYQAIFYAPAKLDDRGGSNLSVLMRSPAPVDLTEAMNANNIVLEERLPEFEVKQLEEQTVGGQSVFWQVYTWKNQEGSVLRQQQLLVISDNILYLFMATRPLVVQNDDILDTHFQHMLNTIELTE